MILANEAAAVQREVALAFGEPVGVRDQSALEAALARPFALKNGIPAYPTFFNKLSALFIGLIEARPFAGANRRTALLIVALLLKERGYCFSPPAEEVKALLQGVELGFTTWHRVTLWIKRHAKRAPVERAL